MNDEPDVAWRLLIQCGDAIGTGFVVGRGTALTCAHVVGDRTKCTVTLPSSGDTRECEVEPADSAWDLAERPWSDVAVVTLPPEFTAAAPLGPASPPPARGALLDVFGYPAAYAGRGQRTQVQVVGSDEFGKSLQVNGLQGYDGQIARGYSGSAAVDVNSGRVVGMVAAADQDPTARIAWVIPLATIAELWHPLRELLPRALSVDPEFTLACRDLNYRNYANALTRLNKLTSIYSQHAEIYLYQVLAGLAGTRPGRYAIETIEAVERRLHWAWQLTPGDPQVAALWAVLKEDYYAMRGFPDSPPSLEELRSAAARITPGQAQLIIDHVNAPECPTWAFLLQRSTQ